MKIIGHRGAAGLAPENTLASLQKALDHGVDEIEFDLRVTKDNIVILHHDEQVTSRNGLSLTIKDSVFSELKRLKPKLTTLTEVLDTLPKSAVLYIEVKPQVNVKPIIKILKSSGRKNYLLGSKSQKTLVKLHQALPDVPKIVIQSWSGVIATARARKVRTKKISMNQKWLWNGFIKRISKNYELYTYTLNDPKKAKQWSKFGLYAVVTDRPDLFSK